MKQKYLFICIGVGAILALTNPTQESYERFLHQQILGESNRSGNLGPALGFLFGGFASSFLSSSAVRTNFVLFSTYHLTLGDTTLTTIGILGNFVNLPNSQPKPSASPSPATQPATQSIPQRPMLSSANRTSGRSTPNDEMQRSFQAGPVLIATYSKCTPLMDECTTHAVAHYSGQDLRLDSVGSYSHPVEAKDISWFDSGYATLTYQTGGNCWTCEGIDVIRLIGNRLSYLGRFSRIDGPYLIKPYDVLESNSLTSRSLSPFWSLYYKDESGVAILDISKTCMVARSAFEANRAKLLNALSTPRTAKATSEYEYWAMEHIKAPLLTTLAMARFCGWRDEFAEVTRTAKSSRDHITYDTLQALNQYLSNVQPVQ